MRACFIGHRTITKTDELKALLNQTIIKLINCGVDTFLFGSSSEFNDLAWEAVTELKKHYPTLKRIYVRSSFQHIDNSYEKYLLKLYEETYFPQKIKNAGKYSYVERNYEMIDSSNFCIFYYNENYTAPFKKQIKHDKLPPKTRNSGTKIAYKYACYKKKTIINLFCN